MEWISVEERMPEPKKPVLVFDNDYKCIYVASYEKLSGCRTMRSGVWVDQPYQWEIETTWRNDQIELDEVTHWMPLPEPPK